MIKFNWSYYFILLNDWVSKRFGFWVKWYLFEFLNLFKLWYVESKKKKFVKRSRKLLLINKN